MNTTTNDVSSPYRHRDYLEMKSWISETNPLCEICFAAVATEPDHRVPVFAGGTSERSNLRASCRSCNRGRSKREAEQMRQLRLGVVATLCKRCDSRGFIELDERTLARCSHEVAA